MGTRVPPWPPRRPVRTTYLTRVQAATALARFGPEVAKAPLLAALKDTSAAVRAAAMGSLSRLRGAGADLIPLARERFEGDQSYAVQAAALGALIRVDSAGRNDWLRRGLATESYQNGVRQTALGAIAQRGDTSFVGVIDSMMGQEQLAGYVLAMLGNRGSSRRALDLLFGHLTDSRSYVRRWAVQAIQNGLPASVSQPRLQAIKDSITDPETKKAVEEMLTGGGGE